MSRFVKITLYLFSIAVIVIVGIIGFHIHTGSSSDNSILSPTQAIADVSVRDVWAVGATKDSQNAQRALFEHWDGLSWQAVPAPATGSTGDELHGVVALTADNAWSVGSSYNFSTNRYGALIEHWDGNKWVLVKSADTPSLNNNLKAIAAVSSRDIWAVGLSFSNDQNQPRQTLIEHWNGSQWSLAKSVNPGGAIVFSAVSPQSRQMMYGL